MAGQLRLPGMAVPHPESRIRSSVGVNVYLMSYVVQHHPVSIQPSHGEHNFLQAPKPPTRWVTSCQGSLTNQASLAGGEGRYNRSLDSPRASTLPSGANNSRGYFLLHLEGIFVGLFVLEAALAAVERRAGVLALPAKQYRTKRTNQCTH